MENAWVKDESKRGTHKDRSFQYWISYLAFQGVAKAVLSSSGSSAFAAAIYCQKAGIALSVFLRQGFPQEKIDQLKRMGAVVYLSKTPKRDAVRMSRKDGSALLRASANPLAVEGYKTLAFEIAEALPAADELFLPVSSGTTLAGLYEGYRILKRERGILMPRLYAVQTAFAHPIAEVFDRDFQPEEFHPARAIIDRIAKRKHEVVRMVRETEGGGYVISARETEEAHNRIPAHGFESALTIAALQRHRTLHTEYATAHTALLFTN